MEAAEAAAEAAVATATAARETARAAASLASAAREHVVVAHAEEEEAAREAAAEEAEVAARRAVASSGQMRHPELEQTPSSLAAQPVNKHQQNCRICLGDETDEPLIQPCACRGTSAWVHNSCLSHFWVSYESAFNFCGP